MGRAALRGDLAELPGVGAEIPDDRGRIRSTHDVTVSTLRANAAES